MSSGIESIAPAYSSAAWLDAHQRALMQEFKPNIPMNPQPKTMSDYSVWVDLGDNNLLYKKNINMENEVNAGTGQRAAMTDRDMEKNINDLEWGTPQYQSSAEYDHYRGNTPGTTDDRQVLSRGNYGYINTLVDRRNPINSETLNTEARVTLLLKWLQLETSNRVNGQPGNDVELIRAELRSILTTPTE